MRMQCALDLALKMRRKCSISRGKSCGVLPDCVVRALYAVQAGVLAAEIKFNPLLEFALVVCSHPHVLKNRG